MGINRPLLTDQLKYRFIANINSSAHMTRRLAIPIVTRTVIDLSSKAVQISH